MLIVWIVLMLEMKVDLGKMTFQKKVRNKNNLLFFF